jgi:DNA adenine methylase
MSPDDKPFIVHAVDTARLRIARRAAELALYSEHALSAEDTVRLVTSSFNVRGGRRLPPLALLAALRCLADATGGHVVADQQTGAVGDIEISLANEDRVATVYEMKQKAVTRDDLDRAIQKVAGSGGRVDHYVFVTTDRIDPAVADYAATLYDATGGTEFALLDCGGFLRHFLHLFHRHRMAFLDAYQSLLLGEPDSAVGLPLKEAFLAMRAAATSDE